MNGDYELFVAIVQAGSLSAAARRLGGSPAQVSKRLARMEARLGARLIQRTTRRLALTAAGQAFYDDVLAILEASRTAEARVLGATANESGDLRITAPTSLGRLYVAPYLASFADAHRDIVLRLDLSDAYEDVFSGGFDVAIRITTTSQPGLVSRTLAPSPRVLCAAPAYLAKHGAPTRIDELGDHRLLAADGQTTWRLEGPSGPVTIKGVSYVGTNSSEVVRELALTGVGIALRSLWDVGPDITAGRLVRLLPRYKGSNQAAICAIYPPTTSATGRITLIADYLQAIYASPAPWER